MTRRVVVGRRSNGDLGIFISPASIDAMSATDAQLILNISSKVSQLILMGAVNGNSVVALGLSRSPFVFVTSESTVAGIPGFSGLTGPVRPSPSGWLGGAAANPLAAASITGNGVSMNIGTNGIAHYAVYNSPFT